MGDTLSLDTRPGRIGGYLARPSGTPRGGLVVVQEIFGVNAHIRSVADRFAEAGYTALAPAIFDYVERDVELAYDEQGVERGRDLAREVGMDRAVAAVAAAAQHLHAGGAAKVAVVGYCWGGSVAFLCNTRLGLPNISYYGARTVPYLHERPRAAMLFHFGERDRTIPAADVQAHREALPQAEVHVYPADHGFNCDVRASYDADSAARAYERTLAFLRADIG
ncbi:dienelactone hydrolase family protein [Coralloluteibacterium stylophorae]|uniref:Dienelactone hydrolase family protein n=1 Tax=Coralloluteibacterium stylophorae TaxID=1776034 RepID=A0A8J8AZD1_9GAMM|nr:dienelactone hydrolase family protein [Coralloluteibacterium stylophorae]MBS7458742.1 dienelactone hydrolase family protein [Coralloluteibacterium stylophorae]